MVFIAGGSGMAPFVSILYWMQHIGSERKATYFFGGNLTKDLFMLDLMQGFEKSLPNFTFIPVVAKPQESPDWQGQTGLVTQAVQRHYQDLQDHEGYLCGSPGMIDASIKVLMDLGMAQEKIYYDKFS
jgi:Na+-transporting NADH:ubiquinone oxidoreductase subunit F